LSKRGNYPYISATGLVKKFNPDSFDPVLRSLSNSIESYTWIPFVGDKTFGTTSVTSTVISDST